MIIVRAPLRITLGGGGTDVLSYANNYGGACLSVTINKYVYIAINHAFKEGIILKYSELEETNKAEDISHPIFREALKKINLSTPQVEIVSIADVPSNGAGLGNSGAFTVGLLKALHDYKNLFLSQEDLAEMACDININKLKNIQGKQDEYASTFGGLNWFVFYKDETVSVSPLKLSHNMMVTLEESLMLFYTGINHSTQKILSYQDLRTKNKDEGILKNLTALKNIANNTKNALERENIKEFGRLMNIQWENKRERMPEQNDYLDHLHHGLLNNGALGAKIVGSGNGGFFLVCADDRHKVRRYMQNNNLQELRFSFDFEGCKRLI